MVELNIDWSVGHCVLKCCTMDGAKKHLQNRGKRCISSMVTEKELAELASHLIKACDNSTSGVRQPWEKVVSALGSSEGDIYKHKEENKYNLWAQCFNALVQWKRRQYKNATKMRLIIACRQCDVELSTYKFLL